MSEDKKNNYRVAWYRVKHGRVRLIIPIELDEYKTRGLVDEKRKSKLEFASKNTPFATMFQKVFTAGEIEYGIVTELSKEKIPSIFPFTTMFQKVFTVGEIKYGIVSYRIKQGLGFV